ncbi:MAG TPA: hypothetical protein VG797_08145 [Phycisphaerales bacterium]|nr:hypothetical protein [Phycisphaerales bacterium]
MKLRAATIVALLASAALASPTVDPAHKFAWTENCGWTNWADANGGASGARIGNTYMFGFVWGENIGWINLGDGTPADGFSYANATGADFGVNRNSSTNLLSGYAWGENVGWINFSGGALASPPQPARYDPVTRRLHGYAWGENIGWINLDDATNYVAFRTACTGDIDGNRAIGLSDIAQVITCWAQPRSCNPKADLDNNNSIGLGDIAVIIGNWATSCP